MLEAGKKLQERYRIERQVGQGGMGSVYLATDERFHSTVAIKEALFGDENYKKAFAREARLLNSLKHSALPKVTDHFVEDNGQYIVMEYIGGDDLFEMMRKSGRAFPVKDVMDWAEQLLDALTYLHEQGIIHRDIKPQNLKLTTQQKIILLDFGLAKGNPTDANYQTAAKSIFGYSRNYASLEQIQGTGTDPRSDVYSLAATIYHLMTDRVPADALTRVMMVLNENKDPLEPAGAFNSEISQEVSDALSECLALKSASRPQNVEEMKALLFSGESTIFAASPSASAAQASDELLTMNTKLIDQTTGDKNAPKQSELKTEVFGAGAGESIQTKVLNKETEQYSEPPNTSSSVFGRRLGLATAAGLIALIIGGVAATVTFWPSIPSENALPSTDNSLESSTANVSEINSESQPVEALEDNTSDGMPEELARDGEGENPPTAKPTPEKAAKIAAVPKPVSKKPAASTGTGKTKKANGVMISGDSIEAGDVKINDKEIIVTKPPATRRPITVRGLPMTREQYEKLTPRQKKRVRAAMELERRRRMKQNPPPQKPKTDIPPPN